MDTLALIGDVLVAVAVSVITSWLYNKYYRQLNRVRFQEEMKISGSAQVFAYNVTSALSLKNIIAQAYSCKNYVIEFEVTEIEEDNQTSKISVLIHPVDIEKLDSKKKWKYIYISNNSKISVLVSKIIDSKNCKINMYDWKDHLIEQGSSIGIFVSLYDEPNSLVLGYNGWELLYQIRDSNGAIPLELAEPNKKR